MGHWWKERPPTGVKPRLNGSRPPLHNGSDVLTRFLQVTFPFDVFKTRMQSSSTLEEGSGTRKPPGLWRVATESIRREGPGVMVAGLWPTVVR